MTLASNSTDWILFFGRLHPLVVHLPIGMLAAVFLAEFFALVQRPEKVTLLRRSLLLVTALSAAGAALVGWFLASEGGYAEDLLFWHRWGGIAFAVILLGGFVFSCSRLWESAVLRFGLLFVSAGVMTVVGHMGGSMTHGETYLARYAPSWLQGVLGGGGSVEEAGAVIAETATGDAQIVLTMLQDHCIECHGPSKQKGSLRLDESDGIMSTLWEGDPGDSELFRRISLPAGHEELMPPDSDPLDDETILAVMRWIRDGAVLGEIEAEFESQAEESEARIEQLEAVEELTGAVIADVPDGDALGYVVNLSVKDGDVDRATFEGLAPIAAQVIELDLSGKSIGEVPADVQFPSLKRLDLQRSDVDLSALKLLVASAGRLESLNLHSTSIGDEVVPLVSGMKELTDLVLFETGVSADAVARIEQASPNLRIERGEELKQAFVGSGPRLILAADYSKKRIAMMREVAVGTPEVVWEHEIRDIHDIQLLDNGHVLFQTSWTELVEVDPESGETVWSYDAGVMNRAYEGEPVEVHAFERYADGRTMIAESGPARIIEVDASGALVHEVPLQVEHPDAHHDTRLVRTTPDDTYLVAHEKDGVIREYDRSGAVVWMYDVPVEWIDPQTGETQRGDGDQAYSAVRLENGNTLIGTGNGHSVLEVNPGGEIVWSVSRDELEGVTLAWVTHVYQLSNGNVVIGNCHAGEGQAQIVEVNREKEVIWKFYDFDRFGNSLAMSIVTEDPDGFAYTE